MKNNELIFTLSTKADAGDIINSSAFDTEIENVTFDDLQGKITFKADLKEIRKSFLHFGNKLKSVDLPDTLTYVDGNSFGYDIPEIHGNNVMSDGYVIVKDDTLLYALDDFSGNEFVVPEGIKAIGKKAFKGRVYIKKVTLPESLERIEEEAFYGCEKVSSIKFPKHLKYIGDRAFMNSGLRSVKITNEVTHIGQEAFRLTNIKSVAIGKGVECIEAGAFCYCPKLEKFSGKYATDDGSLLVQNNVLLAAVYDGGRKVIIPENVEEIAPYAFFDNRNFQSITLPKSLKVIGDYALEGTCCSIDLPDGLEKIGKRAFFGNSVYEKVITIPDSVNEIGAAAFSADYIGTNVTEFKGKFATEDGKFLIEGERLIAAANDSDEFVVSIPSGITFVDDYVFCSMMRNDSKLIIPEGVEKIGEQSFASIECSEISLPSTLKTIGNKAFRGLHVNNGGLYLPNGLESIGESAFNRACFNVDVIQLPATLKYLGAEAFDNISEMTFEIVSENPPVIDGKRVLGDRNVIKLPLKAKDKYVESEDWNVLPNPKEFN